VTEYLSREELEQLLQAVPSQRDKLLVRLLYESGCSISELSDLRTHAIHTDGTVSFGSRKAHISSDLAQELIKQASTYIFHTRQTPTITPKRIQQILKPHIASVHKGKITPHVLRYTHIVHAYQQGLPLSVISQQTGLTCVRLAQIVGELETQKNYTAFFAKRGGKQ
jgi:integrase